MNIHDWYPNIKNPNERVGCVLELDFKKVLEHFQELKKYIGDNKIGSSPIRSDEDVLKKFHRDIESDFSVSSTSLNSSGERTGDEDFESSSLVSTD